MWNFKGRIIDVDRHGAPSAICCQLYVLLIASDSCSPVIHASYNCSLEHVRRTIIVCGIRIPRIDCPIKLLSSILYRIFVFFLEIQNGFLATRFLFILVIYTSLIFEHKNQLILNQKLVSFFPQSLSILFWISKKEGLKLFWHLRTYEWTKRLNLPMFS